MLTNTFANQITGRGAGFWPVSNRQIEKYQVNNLIIDLWDFLVAINRNAHKSAWVYKLNIEY